MRTQIRFLGDPAGEFTKALDLDFDATPIFGNPRSKRYALVIQDGKVKSAHVEPDNTGTNGTSYALAPPHTHLICTNLFLPAVSLADKVLGAKVRDVQLLNSIIFGRLHVTNTPPR